MLNIMELNLDPNGTGNIMIIIIICGKKDGIIINFYQMHRLELDRSRLEIKRENKEVVLLQSEDTYREEIMNRVQ